MTSSHKHCGTILFAVFKTIWFSYVRWVRGDGCSHDQRLLKLWQRLMPYNCGNVCTLLSSCPWRNVCCIQYHRLHKPRVVRSFSVHLLLISWMHAGLQRTNASSEGGSDIWKTCRSTPAQKNTSQSRQVQEDFTMCISLPYVLDASVSTTRSNHNSSNHVPIFMSQCS